MTAPKRASRPRRFEPDAEATEAPWAEDTLPEAEEEERPRRRKARNEDSDDDEDLVTVPFVRGRSAIKAQQSSESGANQYFRWGDNGDVVVVKFVDEEPLAYRQHWVTRAGKQSFPCVGKNCPLCEVGSKTTQKVVYALINISAKEGPLAQALEVSPSLADTLAAYDADTRNGPLSKRWYALSRTVKARAGGFGKYDYHIIPVKDRDLEEDYGIVLDDAEEAVDSVDPIDVEALLGRISRSTLQEVADELMS